MHVILHCLVCILSFNVNNGDTSLFGRWEQFRNELLHSRSQILSRILHISHGIDMIFYETSTKTYFNPPDYTHMHSRTNINQHGRQLICSSSPSAVLIITPSPLAELSVLTPSNNSHPVVQRSVRRLGEMRDENK